MRSSKSRSRSKANRPRTLGNIVNRVFDSSGPEGKVRGTPQQIIEKYLILARDAQLSNDRVAAENFMQHAEHYTRMLGEAQREMAAEQEARQQQGQPGQGQRRDDRDPGWQGQGGDNRQSYGNGNGNGQGDRRDGRSDYRPEQRGEQRADYRTEPRDDRRSEAPRGGVEVIDLSAEDDGHLVETPEARADRREPSESTPRRDRRDDRRDRPAAPSAEAPAPSAAAVEPAPAAEPAPATEAAETKPRAPRRPRGPRKPRDAATAETDAEKGDGPREAAE
ncbi:MAG: DUF4167 domain-containing protein [Paracoccaceae bacterium]|nr:MAG: DUF4167 domain-containing protein [Paracoccaceae bacterium]